MPRHKSPVPAPEQSSTPVPSSAADVEAFLARLRAMPAAHAGASGRLIFAMDATMSRQPAWDMALGVQADMFAAVRAMGGLEVQLVYFRGRDECRASKWTDEAGRLAELMAGVDCRGGYTQIGRVLSHAVKEAKAARVHALVYVGDSAEESIDELAHRAGELALHGTPVFAFHEGHDRRAETAFREIARLTKGAYCRFDSGAASQLRDLLAAVARYAAGGRPALEADPSTAAQGLLEQLN